MQSSWIGWVAFIVLGALISVTSCQAYLGTGNASPVVLNEGSD